MRAFEREQVALGERLRKLRHDAGLAQAEAAEAIGLSEKHARRIELGKANVTLATLVACALVYRRSVAELFEA